MLTDHSENNRKNVIVSAFWMVFGTQKKPPAHRKRNPLSSDAAIPLDRKSLVWYLGNATI